MEIELTNQRVVAIDGGTATGKGRLIEELSQAMRLKGVPVMHLSTGFLYRAVAWAALRGGSDVDRLRRLSGERLLALAQERGVEMRAGVVWADGGPAKANEKLKGPAVGVGSTAVSFQPLVRQFVTVTARREINQFDGFVLVDGRDITHTVAPEAPVKLLLTVSPDIAAARSLEHSLAEVVARDEADRSKSLGALRGPEDPGPGVRVIATDTHTPRSLAREVYGLMRRAWPELPGLSL